MKSYFEELGNDYIRLFVVTDDNVKFTVMIGRVQGRPNEAQILELFKTIPKHEWAIENEVLDTPPIDSEKKELTVTQNLLN